MHLDYENRNRSSNTVSSDYKYLKEDKLSLVNSLYVDFISPMCYHHMVKRETAWIHDVTNNIYEQTNSHILPSIQVSKEYLQNDLTVKEFKDALKQALKAPSVGVVFWNWDAIAESPEKKAIIKKFIIDNKET